MTHKVDEILVWQLLSEEVVFVGVFLESWAQGSVLADPHGVIRLCSMNAIVYMPFMHFVCLHSCVMGLRKRGGIIQQRWHAQSPGPYQYLPPDTAGKIRRLVPWNINHSQEGLRGNCAWNKNSETFRVLIPGPGDPPKDPATTAERWLLKLISYFIYLFRKFPVSLPILHCAITSPYTKPVFNYSYYMLPQQF